jgi:WXG100 family type VII secretion target
MAKDITQVNYTILAELCDQFNSQAATYEVLINRQRGQVENLARIGWKGDGADAFRREMDQDVFPAMLRLKLALESGANGLKRIAAIMMKAEEEAEIGRAHV